MPPNPVDFTKFVEYAFLTMLTGGVAWAAKYLQKISDSITSLNEKVATILERTAWHQNAIERMETRIQKLELEKKEDPAPPTQTPIEENHKPKKPRKAAVSPRNGPRDDVAPL